MISFNLQTIRYALGKPSKSCQIKSLKKILFKCLDISKKGFFIEVGAFDGESFSNTSWLADIGWKGVYIEPILEYADRCRSRHSKNNVTVINCAVGAKDGFIKINVGEQLTTASSGTLEAYKNIEWASNFNFQEREVPLFSLNSLLQNNPPSCPSDLLVVDVEGFEEHVFNGLDLSRHEIKMIIVELADLHPDFNNYPELQQSAARVRSKILESNYKEIYSDFVNTIFLQN